MTARAASDEHSAADYFVARQPIFDRHGIVRGYELLHRSGPENVYVAVDGIRATAELITGGAFMLGFDELVGDNLAFVNFPRELIVGDYYAALPASRTVVELLEDVEADAEVVEACRRLKAAGYGLALDDVISVDDRAALFNVADIVKVDIRPLSRSERATIANHMMRLPSPTKLLAEKVETREQFEEAFDLGFDYFQGYFFGRPTVRSGREIPALKSTLVQLLNAVRRPSPDFEEVAAIVRRDMSLCFKMLRFVEGGVPEGAARIESVVQALMMLGQRGVARMVSLLEIADGGADEPHELAVQSVVRASFCESLASQMGRHREKLDHFMVGMFATIDVILELPMAEVVSPLPTSLDVNAALLGRPGPFREVLELAIACEESDWTRAAILTGQLGLSENAVRSLYADAVASAGDLLAAA
jgi:c-di-GMP-related signal transduction protein